MRRVVIPSIIALAVLLAWVRSGCGCPTWIRYRCSNAVLVFTTAFILLETIFYSVESARDKSIVTTLQLVTIVIAFAVDWLPYTLFGFWLLSAEGRLESRFTPRRRSTRQGVCVIQWTAQR